MESRSSFVRIVLIIGGALLTLALLGWLIWWAIGLFHKNEQEVTVQKVSFTTIDGVKIAGDLYVPNDKPRGAALLLPMMSATKSSWQSFGNDLAGQDYLCLAIDLRGHGDSTHRGSEILNYQHFSDAEHQESNLDIAAGISYLKTIQKIPPHQIGLVGASIGANLALETMAQDQQILWGVLISPGLDYRGIRTEQAIRQVVAPQRLLLVASNDDIYSAETVKRLAGIAPAPSTTTQIAGVSHGTTIFTTSPTVQQEVISWIVSNTTKVSSK